MTLRQRPSDADRKSIETVRTMTGPDPIKAEWLPPVAVTHDRSALCRDILDSLPDWFGRPQAVDRYVATAADQRMLACFSSDGTAIGFLSLHDHGPATTEIHVLGVKPAWHRRGIGRALVEAAAEEAIGRGVRLLTVKTLAPSHPDLHYAMTRRFYDAAGFLPVEVFPTLWGEDLPCLLLARPLPVRVRRTARADETLIEAGERRLLQAGTRAAPSAVAALLADDFVEYGRSGHVSDKPETLASLGAERQLGPGPDREAHGLQVRMLGEDFALVTYRSSRRTPGGPDIDSLRSSVWRRDGDRWKLLFHQGTPAAL